MKKRTGVSKNDYEWLQYNALVEISNKLTKIITCLGSTYDEELEQKEEVIQLCNKCGYQMVWTILANKWVCNECANTLTISDMIINNKMENQS